MRQDKLRRIINKAAKSGQEKLDLSRKGIRSFPAQIGKLTQLQQLDLDGNQLTSLPAKIGKLTKLTELRFDNNQLTSVPAEIGKLTQLQRLDLDGNQLTSLPSQIGKLTKLRKMYLNDNQLTSLPAEIGKLSQLRTLFLHSNRLTSLPAEIGKLTQLQELYLHRNQLTSLPAEIWKLTQLQRLDLDQNQLSSLAGQIGKLTQLRSLWIRQNRLTSLPAEIGKLTQLQLLGLEGNQLTSLPAEMGNLTQVRELFLRDNPLTSPPPSIVEQGTEAVLAYLREQLAEAGPQWVSKLLLVGQGNVGKTCLLRALLGEPFVEGLETTHGIDIETLRLPHPAEADVTMELNAWDFGGQDIYHATHQFFLTDRSLFLLVWNARDDWQRGNLHYWLDQVKAKAPESPVIVVAAHADEREPHLPLADLKREYPGRIAGCYAVSNKTGAGIAELREAIAAAAADLPLMGQQWPAAWLRAAEAIRKRPEDYVEPADLAGTLLAHGVDDKAADVLTRWLHDLGDILYFQDNRDLADVVFLAPEWVTGMIYRVLDCQEVETGLGIFRRRHMEKVWRDVPGALQNRLLRLMEQFDLSYRTLEDEDISIVVERLGLDPPAGYEEPWNAIAAEPACKEIAMRYRLNTVPAGIPTWFIARSHRFTTYKHWRTGALFQDHPEDRHFGLVRVSAQKGQIELAARGPSPHNFFAILRDGLELTLRRFPGLDIKRTIPCPGHDDRPCPHEFDYRNLERAIERAEPVLDIQCPEAFEDVSVGRMLFGLHVGTGGAVLEEVRRLRAEMAAMDASAKAERQQILSRVGDLLELSQREFTKLFGAHQSNVDTACPNVFSLVPVETKKWRKTLVGQKAELRLWCQEPGCWHMVEGGFYTFTINAEWLQAVGPYVAKLVTLLKYAAPLAGPFIGMAAAEYAEQFKHHLKAMDELVRMLPDVTEAPEDRHAARLGFREEPERACGEAFRALRRLLDRLDPQQNWGGLRKLLTPEGHWLWLCPHHAKPYRR